MGRFPWLPYYRTRFYSCALPRATEVLGYKYQLSVLQTLQLRATELRATARDRGAGHSCKVL
eukprot:COSAG05_NODE_1766_length_4119_cov_3.978856_1_plen_62_part_00